MRRWLCGRIAEWVRGAAKVLVTGSQVRVWDALQRHRGERTPVASPAVARSPLRLRETGWVLLALLPLVAVVVLATLLGDGGGGDPSKPHGSRPTVSSSIPEPELRARLLAAYERSRRATWLVSFDFRRRLVNGGRLDLEVVELNRPPDHLVAGLGGLSGSVAGRRVVCDQVEGRELCAPEGPAISFEDELAGLISELSDVLQPPAKWYAVEAGGGREIAGEQARCYVLRRIVAVPSPPYGERAEYCYAADGVPLLTRIERREGTDERVATEVSRQVTQGDVDALLAG